MTGSVRLWLIHADAAADELARFHDALDDGERARAASLIHPPDRHKFTVAHGALRVLIGREIGVAPSTVTFTIGQHGKPALAGSGPHLNLSHSGDISAVAVCWTRPVGVDVQHLVPSLDTIGMSTRFFGADEAEHVAGGHDAGDRADRFAQLWARKEAVIKAAGGRLWPNLRLPVHRRDLVRCDQSPAPGIYRVTDVAAPDGFRAAVALAGGEPYAVEVLDWAATGSMAATDR